MGQAHRIHRIHRINERAGQELLAREWEATHTLDRQIAEAFADMTPERRAQLEREWDNG